MYDWNRVEARSWTGRSIALVDETLRDGLQSPSAIDPPIEVKLRILHAMADLGVDIASVGLPAAGARARRDASALASRDRRPAAAAPRDRRRAHRRERRARGGRRDQPARRASPSTSTRSSAARRSASTWRTGSSGWLVARVRAASEARARGQPPVLPRPRGHHPHPPRGAARAVRGRGRRRGRSASASATPSATPIRGAAAALVEFARSTLARARRAPRRARLARPQRSRPRARERPRRRSRGRDGVHGSAGGFGERTGNTPMEHLVAQLAELRIRAAVPKPVIAAYARTALTAIDSSHAAHPSPTEHRAARRRSRSASTARPSSSPSARAGPSSSCCATTSTSSEPSRAATRGDCGACTVLVDGEPALACLTLAAACAGRSVTTVESLSGARLDPLLDAFDRRGAGQCGFCTPGMLMTAKALLAENSRPDRAEIRAAIWPATSAAVPATVRSSRRSSSPGASPPGRSPRCSGRAGERALPARCRRARGRRAT